MLLYDHNQPKTFHSAAWDTYTKPDLTFFTHDTNSSLPYPLHSVLGNFPKSQHRPKIIYHPALIEYTPTSPLPRWNFNKADWERFHAAARNMCEVYGKTTFLNGMPDTMNFPPNLKKRSPWREAVVSKPPY